MKNEFIEKIKSRGYWRVNFQPKNITREFSLDECRALVEKNKVSFRGWNYPHYPGRRGDDTGIEHHNTFYQGWIDWENHKEFWRMYQSGQFLHYVGLREDWYEEAQLFRDDIRPMEKLNIIGSVIYELTEIYEFLSRLSKEGVYDDGVLVKISLCNTLNRELWLSEHNRVPLFDSYRSYEEEISFTEIYFKEELIIYPQKLALKAIRHFFSRFGWNDVSDEVIMKDQNTLINSNFYS